MNLEEMETDLFSSVFEVTLNDDRKMYGQINCIDEYGTIGMNECLIFLPPHKRAPLNDYFELQFQNKNEKEEYFDSILGQSSLSQEEKDSFLKNGFYKKGVIFPRIQIKSLKKFNQFQ